MLNADRELRLAEEIAAQLGRVVPAGILEIKEPQRPIGRQERVVETIV